MADTSSNNPSLTPKSRGGRPKATVPRTSSVSTWLAAHEHDRLIALAKRHDTSVSSLVRKLLIVQLR